MCYTQKKNKSTFSFYKQPWWCHRHTKHQQYNVKSINQLQFKGRQWYTSLKLASVKLWFLYIHASVSKTNIFAVEQDDENITCKIWALLCLKYKININNYKQEKENVVTHM